ncbi:MAG: HlyD family type I secretion periplasmic adaptor subunit [Methylococcaceae bacterium]
MKTRPTPHKEALAFLPDAEEIERTPINSGIPITMYVLLALFVSLLIWASVSEIDQVVTARGRLVTPLPNIVLQPFETARIMSLPVRMGQIVSKGQTLATLDPTIVTADLAQLKDRLNSMDAQMRRLESERHGTHFESGQNEDDILQASLDQERRGHYRARLQSLEETIGRLQAAINTNRQDIASLETWVKSLHEIESMNSELYDRKYQTRQLMLESREKRISVERDLVVARNHEVELRRDLAAAEADKKAFTQEWKQKTLEELVETRRERDSLAEQIHKAELRNRLINLEAPEDGVVLEIAKLSPGSIVREAEAFITLVPLAATLEAEVQIDTADIGRIKVGDPVRVKIDAYPFQKHGILTGQLAKLSQDSFVKESQDQQASAYYLGRVDLGPIVFRNLDKPARLIPGMSMTAEIKIGKRTVMSYFLYPMIKAFDEAGREP